MPRPGAADRTVAAANAAGGAPAALARLASALVEIEPLSGALGHVPRVVPLAAATPRARELDAVQALTDRLAWELGVPSPRMVLDSSDLVAAELAISGVLGITELLDGLGAGPDAADATDDQVATAIREARRGRPAVTAAVTPDGSQLRCYALGPTDAPAVVLVSACGMPVGLARHWMLGLADRFRVLTWESRGMFPAPAVLDDEFDSRGVDVWAQASDLHTLLDLFEVDAAHVVGLCGGAAVALAAGPDRMRSMSLWHGDYELGPDAPKTRHQQDVQSLMEMAGRQRTRAAGLHALLRRPAVLDSLRADLAHQLIYPYACPELLYRYGRLNGAIMTTDCRPLLAGIDIPTLVVTSSADTTAHPDGSRWVASRMPRARLHLLPAGDHLTAFDAGPELIALAAGFIDSTLDPTSEEPW